MKWSITPINKNRPNSIKRGRLERLQGVLRDETLPVVLCTVLCSMVLCSTISPLASFHAPSLTDDYRITPFFSVYDHAPPAGLGTFYYALLCPSTHIIRVHNHSYSTTNCALFETVHRLPHFKPMHLTSNSKINAPPWNSVYGYLAMRLPLNRPPGE